MAPRIIRALKQLIPAKTPLTPQSSTIFDGRVWLTPDCQIVGAIPGAAESAAQIAQTIPMVRDGERAIDLVSLLLEEGMLDITGTINDGTAKWITAQLQVLKQKLHREPTVYFNSGGGSVSSGLAIYDLFQVLGQDVTTIVNGTAASMAAVLLAAGTKGKRMALPHSLIMIHQPSVGGLPRADGTDMEIHNKQMQLCKKRLTAILAKHCERDFHDIAKFLERDHWMTAEEALEFGLIDKIIDKPPPKPSDEE